MKKAFHFIATSLLILAVLLLIFVGPGSVHAQQVSESARIERERAEAIERQEQELRSFNANPTTVREYTQMRSRHFSEIQAYDQQIEAARFAEAIAHLSREEQWAAIDRRDYEQYLRALRHSDSSREDFQITEQYRAREAAKKRQREALLAQQTAAQASAEEQESLRAEAERQWRDQMANTGGGGNDIDTAAVATATTIAAMAAAKVASEAWTESNAATIGRGGDIFVFCHEGPEGGQSSNGWYPVSPLAGAYVITQYCSGVPCPSTWNYIAAYQSLCPQGLAAKGEWAGPGGEGSIGQYQSSGGSQHKGSPENQVNGLMPFMH